MDEKLSSRKARLERMRCVACKPFYYVLFVRDDSRLELELVAFASLVVFLIVVTIFGAAIYDGYAAETALSEVP